MSGKRLAFLIASDDYKILPKLNGPSSDVKNLAEILRDKTIGRFEVITSINEGSVSVKEKLHNFTLNTQSDDLILIYFSGHGIMDPKYKSFYLSTIDTSKENPEANAISNTTFLMYLNQSYSKMKVVILDCCHSASISYGMKNSGLGSLFADGKDLFLLTATDEFQVAKEELLVDKGKGSVFTSILVHGLKTGDADMNGDGIITPADIKSYLEKRVPEQDPKCWLSSFGEEQPLCWVTPLMKKISPDPILDARIDNLLHNLDLIKNQPIPWESINGKIQVEVEKGVWDGLETAKRIQTETQMKILDEIRQALAGAEKIAVLEDRKESIKECWKKFSCVYDTSQEFFDEYLELIGGLLLRDIREKEIIYSLADELLNNCIEDSVGTCVISPAIPALPETLIKAFARIIGLKFPEWTIWTLPYVAHELGHILIKQVLLNPENVTFMKDYEVSLPSKDLDDLVADAFATIISGPSYACAWFILGFNPELPLHIKRAYVILKILELMNKNASSSRPYNSIFKIMEGYSELLANGSFQIEKLEPRIDFVLIDKLIIDIWDSFSKRIGSSFRHQTQYPSNDPKRGWIVANELYFIWLKDLEKQSSISNSKIYNVNMLRDVLNAAWLCRLVKPEFEDEIGFAAQMLCDSIVKDKRLSKRSASPESIMPFAEKEPKKGSSKLM